MKKLISKILHVLYPTKCVFCEGFIKDSKIRICNECAKSISYNRDYCIRCGDRIDAVFGPPICQHCRGKNRHFERVFVPLIYKDKVRNSILSFKFRGRKSYSKTFAILIFTHLRQYGFIPDKVTFVPIHKKRLLKRGYNQTEVVAKELATLLNVPCLPLLKKSHFTQKLSTLSFAQRINTVKGSFEAINTGDNLKDNNILLVDDIITTSATAEECCSVLKKAFGCKLYVAAIASSERHKK